MSFRVGPATVTPVVEMAGRGFDVFRFTGDVLHHRVQVLNPQLSCMGCLAPEQAAATRTRVLDRCADEGAILVTGHVIAPHAARIERTGDGFGFRLLCEEVAAG